MRTPFPIRLGGRGILREGRLVEVDGLHQARFLQKLAVRVNRQLSGTRDSSDLGPGQERVWTAIRPIARDF